MPTRRGCKLSAFANLSSFYLHPFACVCCLLPVFGWLSRSFPSKYSSLPLSLSLSFSRSLSISPALSLLAFPHVCSTSRSLSPHPRPNAPNPQLKELRRKPGTAKPYNGTLTLQVHPRPYNIGALITRMGFLVTLHHSFISL